MADGVTPGYPVAIIGGQYGDLPLDIAAAEPLAEIIARENLPTVLDFSEVAKSAQQGFLAKFLHQLRRSNRDALTIVLEEADVFAPQNPLGDDSKMLHAEVDWIARRGRFRGFRLISVTQRPARLAKDVLTQAATLIAHRLPAPQDAGAVMAWIEGNGDATKGKEVEKTLASLETGEAWVWATEGDFGLRRVRLPMIRTLDTSATPKAGERRVEPKTLAEVDLSAIEAALAEANEAKPAPKATTTANDNAIRKARDDGFQEGVRQTQDREYRRGFGDGLSKGLQQAKDAIDAVQAADAAPEPKRAPLALPAPPPAASAPRPARAVASGGAEPLLEVAHAVWPAKLTWAALAASCGRKARGGHWNHGMAVLRQNGLIVDSGGRLSIAPELL